MQKKQKNIFQTLIIIISLLILSQSVLAGGKDNQFGIGLTVTESSPSLMLRYWMSDYATFEPEFAFSRVKTDDDSKATEYIPGFGILYHWNPQSNLRPYVGVRVIADIMSGNDETYTDFYTNLLFGCEYFISDRFSITGEYRFTVISTDSDFSPSWLTPSATYLNTGQMLSVHFYLSKGK